MLGPVSASVGDRLWTGKPPRLGARHPGLLSLSLPSVQAGMSTWAGESWGRKQAYGMTHQPVSMVLQCSLIARLNGLASGVQHQLTGSGSTLEACL